MRDKPQPITMLAYRVEDNTIALTPANNDAAEFIQSLEEFGYVVRDLGKTFRLVISDVYSFDEVLEYIQSYVADNTNQEQVERAVENEVK